MTGAEEFWAFFLSDFPEIPKDTPYQTWFFGNSPEMADELAKLVIAGTKTATASLQATNLKRPDEAPVEGGYSVVTDHSGRPLFVIQTTEIQLVPFDEVGEEFAAAEGEGDLSLEYWRRVHLEYFTREADELELEFNDGSIICCERFKLLFTG